MDSPAAARLRFIQDFYGPAYADLEADHVCCRDTLEHIGKVADFMRLIRRSIGDRADRRGFLLSSRVPSASWSRRCSGTSIASTLVL